MNASDQIFEKYEDETGEEYYCPVNTVADDPIVSEWEIDNCVEVSTANRYSGNILVVDRNTSWTHAVLNLKFGMGQDTHGWLVMPTLPEKQLLFTIPMNIDIVPV